MKKIAATIAALTAAFTLTACGETIPEPVTWEYCQQESPMTTDHPAYSECLAITMDELQKITVEGFDRMNEINQQLIEEYK